MRKQEAVIQSTAFIDAARDIAQGGTLTDDMRYALYYLIEYCVNWENAIPLEELAREVRCVYPFQHGTTKQVNGYYIQHKLIIPSHLSSWFLGTCHKGVYIIANPDDLDKCASAKINRIAAEQTNLLRLLGLGDGCGLSSPAPQDDPTVLTLPISSTVEHR